MANLRRSQIFLGLLLALTSLGCRSGPLSLSPSLPTAATLTIQAAPLGNGEFELTGTTDLPNNTPLTAIALRHLGPKAGSAAPTEDWAYSILDFQPATVADGQWSARLSLWRVANDGRYQEAWQAHTDALALATQPRDTVQFAVAVAPDHLGTVVHDALAQGDRQRLSGILRTTPEGDPFLWADQVLPVALPNGQTTPPADVLARANGGWGQRYLLVPEPPLPYTLAAEDLRQTTAPPGVDEQLR